MKRNAARLAVNHRNLRKRRGRKAVGKVACGLKAVVPIVIRIVMPKLLQNQRDGVEVFGIKRSVENPRDHGASFFLRMHIEQSSTTPLASNYGAPVFHELTVPGAAPIPSACKLFLHMRPLRGASMRSMRYIKSVFSMPLRERCRSTYHRLTEHGGVPDRRTAWDPMWKMRTRVDLGYR